jgi:hypothetical protein
MINHFQRSIFRQPLIALAALLITNEIRVTPTPTYNWSEQMNFELVCDLHESIGENDDDDDDDEHKKVFDSLPRVASVFFCGW